MYQLTTCYGEQGGILEVKLDALELNPKKIKASANVKKGNYVRLTISDTGIGMDKQTIDRIFEPFFTNKEVGSGSGLGLSVVHGIVNNYNGAIQVQSEPGKGTIFMIYLPQHSAHGFEDSQVIEKTRKGSENILFVDDEKEITYMGKENAGKPGIYS